VTAQEIASVLDRPFVLSRREPRQLSEFVREMRLIVESARQCELAPVDSGCSLRYRMDVQEPQDSAEFFW
jgi:hypothetical protein